MKIASLTFVLFIGNLLSAQTDSSQVKHTNKISNLLNKVHAISEKNIEHKHQIINKSKIDSLMFRIDGIKTEQPVPISSKKQDSLIAIINSLQSISLQKDSLILALKNQLEIQQLSNHNYSKPSPKKTNNYIVLGAYLIKSNAEKQVRNLQQYNVEIVSIPSSKLHYIVYSLRPNEKITPTLLKFRKQIEPNAWIISF